MPPHKKFERFSLWKCSFAARQKLRNHTVSDKETLLTDTLRLTLQFPLTETGWKRIESSLEINHSGFAMIRLLAATPFQEEQQDVDAPKGNPLPSPANGKHAVGSHE